MCSLSEESMGVPQKGCSFLSHQKSPAQIGKLDKHWLKYFYLQAKESILSKTRVLDRIDPPKVYKHRCFGQS